MKKIFTLALLLVTVLTANAESRTWDFRSWSAATLTNLQKGLSANFSSDAAALNPACGWSDIEKSSGDKAHQANAVNGKCFWEVKAQGNATTGATLCADGQPITEFEGLLYTNTTARSLAIAVDYNSGGGYNGATYLWTGSKQKNYFVIPNVAAGAKITMGVESHSSTEARGYELYIVPKGKYSTKGTKLKDIDGNIIAVPTKYVEQTWYVPEEGLSDTPNEDGTYDVLIYNTNGAHIYFIKVDEGDNMDEDRKIAWIGNTTPGATITYAVRPTVGFEYTDIDGSDAANVTDEILRGFDAVVIDNDVTTETAAYEQLKKNIAFVPMVNLNTSLFGYTPAGESTTMTVTKADDDIWEGLSLEDGAFDYTANVSVTLPELFANDDTLALQGENVAIHRHNNGAGKNSYFLLGSTDDLAINYAEWSTLLSNLLVEAAKSKRDVTAAAAPTFTLAYADRQTTVTMACATNGSKIYYKEGDGEYKLYTEPILYTEETNLTAYAESEGFLQSAEATKTVDIQIQAVAPVLSIEQQDGKSIITLTADNADAKVYYSFSGQTKAAKAATYAEPVEVTEPGTITAFAVEDGKLQSELVTGDILVKGIPEVTDTLAHFTGNEADWFTNAEISADGTTFTPLADAIADTDNAATGAAKAVYYFGKSSWTYYSDEVDHYVDGTDEDGNATQTPVYKPNENVLRVVKSTSDTDWIIESEGQVITGETNVSAGTGVYTGTSDYLAEEAIDEIGGTPSKGKIDFGGKASGDPYTMRIVSTKQYSGTFDVVTYLANGGTSDLGIELQKSIDGTTWETVGNLNYTKSQRLHKKTRFHMDETAPVYLRVAQVSGGAKGQIYDIYVIRTVGTSTAISNVKAETESAAKVGKFVKDGRIYIQKGAALYNVAGAQVK